MASKDELKKKYFDVTGKDPDPDWTGKQLVDNIKSAQKSEKTNEDSDIGKKESEPDPIDRLANEIEKTNSRLSTLITGIQQLIESNERVESVGSQNPATIDRPKVEEEKYSHETDPTVNQEKYIPKKFREIVDSILSPEFGIDVQDFDNTTDFLFSIFVPYEYSSLTPKEKEMKKQDVRSKMISRAKGENGVRDWAMLVRQNLNKYYTMSGTQSPFKGV